tara:strand:+ start:1215 stop:1538 length:324 start_codon:yes stop_codon:yes gene_type:complete
MGVVDGHVYHASLGLHPSLLLTVINFVKESGGKKADAKVVAEWKRQSAELKAMSRTTQAALQKAVSDAEGTLSRHRTGANFSRAWIAQKGDAEQVRRISEQYWSSAK